jgi:hypothetical protein
MDFKSPVDEGRSPHDFSTEAVEFVRFCHARRRVGWPELYDEMWAVASRGLYRGLGFEELSERGISFSLFGCGNLAAIVSWIAAEEASKPRPADRRRAGSAATAGTSRARRRTGPAAAAATTDVAIVAEAPRAVELLRIVESPRSAEVAVRVGAEAPVIAIAPMLERQPEPTPASRLAVAVIESLARSTDHEPLAREISLNPSIRSVSLEAALG